jgi:hypothetical protein
MSNIFDFRWLILFPDKISGKKFLSLFVVDILDKKIWAENFLEKGS